MKRVMQAALFALLLGGATICAAGDERPNILFILADDVGREVLGCYGGESYKTPHLDTLAEGGMRFEHCYSMPVCHPSRVCLLTGRYPAVLGNPTWGSFPRSEEPNTFASILRTCFEIRSRHGASRPVTGKLARIRRTGGLAPIRYMDPTEFQNTFSGVPVTERQ
jgi:hypothetical protein